MGTRSMSFSSMKPMPHLLHIRVQFPCRMSNLPCPYCSPRNVADLLCAVMAARTVVPHSSLGFVPVTALIARADL